MKNKLFQDFFGQRILVLFPLVTAIQSICHLYYTLRWVLLPKLAWVVVIHHAPQFVKKTRKNSFSHLLDLWEFLIEFGCRILASLVTLWKVEFLMIVDSFHFQESLNLLVACFDNLHHLKILWLHSHMFTLTLVLGRPLIFPVYGLINLPGALVGQNLPLHHVCAWHE